MPPMTLFPFPSQRGRYTLTFPSVARPPGSQFFSTMQTVVLFLDAAIAAATPAIPPPIMTTS